MAGCVPCGSGGYVNPPATFTDAEGRVVPSGSIVMRYKIRLADGTYYSDANGVVVLFDTAGDALTVIDELGGQLEGQMVMV